MSQQADVKDALTNAALAVLADRGFWVVERENVEIDPSGATKVARLLFGPARPSVLELGPSGSNLHTGILQINLDYRKGDGDATAQADADAVAAAFPVGSNVISSGGQGVTIYSAGRDGFGRLVDGWWRVSVTVEWEAILRR